VEQRWYPAWDSIVFGIRWSTFIWWVEPLALLTVCILWGILLAKFIEIPANKWLRRLLAPAKA
jgi:hypothetical protein